MPPISAIRSVATRSSRSPKPAPLSVGAALLLGAPAGMLLLVAGCELLPLPLGSTVSVGGSAGAGGAVCEGGGAMGGAADGAFAPECANCHGAEGNPAPPPDTRGELDPASPGVGAHAHMLRPASWHRRVRCGECHPVPRLPTRDPCLPSHQNGETDLRWGPVAVGGIYDEASHGCSYTHCHGTLCGPDANGYPATVRVPIWTLVDGSQGACGQACHSLPPGGTHQDVDRQCEHCHGGVIEQFDPDDPSASSWTDPDRHIDGVFENDAGSDAAVEDGAVPSDAGDAAVEDGAVPSDAGDAAAAP